MHNILIPYCEKEQKKSHGHKKQELPELGQYIRPIGSTLNDESSTANFCTVQVLYEIF